MTDTRFSVCDDDAKHFSGGKGAQKQHKRYWNGSGTGSKVVAETVAKKEWKQEQKGNGTVRTKQKQKVTNGSKQQMHESNRKDYCKATMSANQCKVIQAVGHP